MLEVAIIIIIGILKDIMCSTGQLNTSYSPFPKFRWTILFGIWANLGNRLIEGYFSSEWEISSRKGSVWLHNVIWTIEVTNKKSYEVETTVEYNKG